MNLNDLRGSLCHACPQTTCPLNVQFEGTPDIEPEVAVVLGIDASRATTAAMTPDGPRTFDPNDTWNDR